MGKYARSKSSKRRNCQGSIACPKKRHWPSWSQSFLLVRHFNLQFSAAVMSSYLILYSLSNSRCHSLAGLCTEYASTNTQGPVQVLYKAYKYREVTGQSKLQREIWMRLVWSFWSLIFKCSGNDWWSYELHIYPDLLQSTAKLRPVASSFLGTRHATWDRWNH